MKKNRLISTLASREAFTLTEMLIVIALLAVITTLVGQNVMSKFTKGKVDTTKIQIRQLGVALDDFKRECGFYPSSDQGLDALVRKPTGGRECKNYDPEGYIKGGKIPQDGFDSDFVYESEGGKYKIISYGADGQPGGEGTDADIDSDTMD